MTRYCGYPSPNWLRTMIIKLYRQMTEIRVHAEKDCCKIIRPESNFSPTIQMWYDRIHAYLQLIRVKEGKVSNASNIVPDSHRKTGGADNGGVTGRASILPNKEGRSETTSKRSAEGTLEGLPIGRPIKETERTGQSYQTETTLRREQKDVVSDPENGKRPLQSQRT